MQHHIQKLLKNNRDSIALDRSSLSKRTKIDSTSSKYAQGLQKSPFTKQFIKQSLQKLIRKEGQPRISINRSIEKCRSRFSQSKLKEILNGQNKNWIDNVVMRRYRKSIQSTIINGFPNESNLTKGINMQDMLSNKLRLDDETKENQQNDLTIRKQSNRTFKITVQSQCNKKISVASKKNTAQKDRSMRSVFEAFYQ